MCVFFRLQGEEEVEETPAEILYLGMLPNLSQYVVSAMGTPPPCTRCSETHITAAGRPALSR